jgi:hypothetical protein
MPDELAAGHELEATPSQHFPIIWPYGVAQKYNVHRRTVRAALKNAVPSKRKVTPRERPKMARAIPVIDAILNSDLKAQFNQRHTAHQIWEQLQIEIAGCDVGESTVQTYVRVRKAELDGAGQASSQIALAMKMRRCCIVTSLCRSLKKSFQAAQCQASWG